MLIALAVAYQFAKIGNDEGGKTLVASLDDDSSIGQYIDCMGMVFRP